MPPAHSSADELLGVTIVGRYRIISQLGAGGMGTAYRAWDEQAAVPVVIKIPRKRFLEDPKFAERFRREIRLLQGLSHPHVVPIVDDGEHEGLPFVVMRFLPGGSLSNRRLRDEGGRVMQNPPGFLHLWLPAVADALDAIHASGVVHRDVKPANIFFDAGWGAFVGDFGIAKIVAESDVFDGEHTLTATHMGIGTPDYMAPEQFAPKAVIDGRADQYALAVVVHEMLAGARPFTGEAANLIVEIMTQPAPRLDRTRSDLPPSLVAAVDRGLAKRPGERFATCGEFAAAVLRDVPPLAEEPGVARLLCPKCASLLKLPTSAAGRKGKCPKCQTEMKVADDLGAMWLLDEARRHEDAASVGWIGAGGSAAGSDGPSLEDFRLVSGRKPIRRAPRHSRRGILAWIDGHGLIIVGTMAIMALIPWILPAGKNGNPKAARPESGSRPQAEKKALERQLVETGERVQSLQGALEESRQAVAKLETEVAGLRSKPTPRQSRPPVVDAREDLTNSIGTKLRLIPAGTFMMGSDDGDPDEKPIHEVRITRPFYLGVLEVTNAEWKAVMGSVPSRFKDDDRPVERVSWDDVVQFCEKLSALPAEQAAGRVYRLPTEAEWEYACRAATTTRFWFGDADADIGESAWFCVNAGGETHPVGQKRGNPWGLFDVYGNVWEWCADRYGPYPGGEAAGPAKPSARVQRGGGINDPVVGCRSADRRGSLYDASSRAYDLGFRLAASMPGSTLQEKAVADPFEER